MDANVVLFSKDRAMQLEALLQSMLQFAPRLLEAGPKIIVRASTQDFKRAYEHLQSEFPNVTWIWELPMQLQSIVLDAVSIDCAYTMFLVDDTVFYRVLPEIQLNPGDIYSPSLGRNCTHCYSLNKPQKEGELDFLYAYSLNGHIHRTDEIRPKLLAIGFRTVNELEDRLYSKFPVIPLKYAEDSCLVGIPHNVVQWQYPNRFEGGSAADLNARYLAGWRLDLAAMDFSHVCAVHQAIPLVFKKYNGGEE